MANDLSFTFGFSTRDDSDGAWMTVNDFFAHHRHEIKGDFEFVVIDNSPKGSQHQKELSKYLKTLDEVRYISPETEFESSCLYKDMLFRVAKNDFVVCCDSHVIYDRNSVKRLVQYFEKNPTSNDLIMGPCRSKYNNIIGTNQMIRESEGYPLPSKSHVCNGFVWSGGALGVWVKDKKGLNPEGPAFEIQQQGTGAFACRKEAWPGFMSTMKGHGGNETYLMESFRKRGHKVLCLPGFLWIHRFIRANGTPYSVKWEDRVKNYLVGFQDLDDIDLFNSALEHFETICPKTKNLIAKSISPPRSLLQNAREKLGNEKKHIPGQVPESLFYRLKRLIPPGKTANTIEFGSGVTTLLFDELSRKHTAIEHSKVWYDKVKPHLKNTDYILSDIEKTWYSWRPTGEKYDVILIDGPPGQDSTYERSGCVYFLEDMMSDNCSIVVDDTNREKENALAKHIQELYSLQGQTFNDNGRKYTILQRVTKDFLLQKGVGTELEKLIKKILKIEPMAACGCKAKIREMNQKGPEWCKENIELITDWLMEGSKKWTGATQKDKMIKRWIDIAPDFGNRKLIQFLIMKAYRNCTGKSFNSV